MSANPTSRAPGYTAYHPRWYRKRVSTYWWLHQKSYFKFVMRELSSIFVAIFVVMTLLQIRAVSHGPQAYAEFQLWMKRPLVVALNAVSLAFVIFHSVTWLNLAPRAMAVRLRGKRVPELLIATVNYAAWLVISGIVAWILLGG